MPTVAHRSRGGVGHAAVIALLGGAQALILLAGLVRWKIIALFLGPAGVGIAGIIDQTAQVVLQIGALNIPTSALRFLAIAEQERGIEGFAWLYRTFVRITLSATAIAVAVAVFVYLLWPQTLGVGMGGYRAAVVLGIAAVPLTACTNLIRNVLATLQRLRTSALVLIAGSVLLAGGTVAGLRLGGLAGAYLAAFIVGLATALSLHLFVLPVLKGVPKTRSGSLLALLRAHPDIVRFSLTLYAVGFSIPLGYSLVRWTVLTHLGAHEAGFLAAAFTIAAGLRAVFSAASSQYLIPLTSRDLPKQVRVAAVGKFARTLVLLLLAGVLPLLLFPYEVLLALYSRSFVAATDVLGIFIMAEVVMSLGDAYRVLQLGFNDLRGYFVTTCCSMAIVGANITWVVGRYGLRGAAILQAVSAVIVLIWSIDRIRSRHGVRVEWRSLGMTAYALLALTIAVLLGRAAPEPRLVLMGVKAGVGVLLLVGAWLLLPRGERDATLSSLPFRRGLRGSPPPRGE